MNRILVIEDDVDIREMLRDYLRITGYEVECTGNGSEGIAMHQEEYFDLVIMNILLPDVEGLELIPEIRRTHNTKIIAVSCLIGGLDMAKRNGAHYTFAMPLDVKELGRVAADLLEKK